MKKCCNNQCGAELEDYQRICPQCGCVQKIKPFVKKTEKIIKKIELQRHGFITFWLFSMMIGNAILFFIRLFPKEAWGSDYPDSMVIYSQILAIACPLTIIGVIMLLMWKKNGFYVILFSSLYDGLLVLFLFGSYPIGVLGVLVLYFILGISKNGIPYWEAMDYARTGHIQEVNK